MIDRINQVVTEIGLLFIFFVNKIMLFFNDLPAIFYDFYIYLEPLLKQIYLYLSTLGIGILYISKTLGEYLASFFLLFSSDITSLFYFLNKQNFFFALFAAVITIGTVNWTVWFIRRTRSIFYDNYSGEFSASASVIIPVYKEKKVSLWKLLIR